MRGSLRRSSTLIVPSLVAVLVAACNLVSHTSAERIALSPTQLNLQPGQSAQVRLMSTNASGQDAPSAQVAVWSSTAPAVVTVDQTGEVTALAPGNGAIVATVGLATATAPVVVSALLTPDGKPVIASLALSPVGVEIFPGDTLRIHAYPRDALGGSVVAPVEWSSSDSSVVAVDSTGLIHALRQGMASVVSSAGGARADATVSVGSKAQSTGGGSVLTLSPSSLSLGPGETATISADLSGATASGLSWSTSNASVARVDSAGHVTAIASGVATITATGNGATAVVNVTVTSMVASVSVSPSSRSLQTGDSFQLSATLRNADGAVVSGPSVTWSTTDPAVASVSATGLVEALTSGSANISASAGGAIGWASVSVSASAADSSADPVVTSIVLSPTSASLPVGGTTQLAATPTDAAGQPVVGATVSWASSDPRIATVSPTSGAGVTVAAVAPGLARITASSESTSDTVDIVVNDTTTPTLPAGAGFFDNFDKGHRASTNQYGFGWTANSANVSVSNDIAHSGRYSLKFLYHGHADTTVDATAQQRFTMGPGAKEVWIQYYFYLTDGTEGLGARFYQRSSIDNNKFFVLWAKTYSTSGGPQLECEYRPSKLAGPGDSYLYCMWSSADHKMMMAQAPTWDPAFTDALRGHWTQVRIHAKLSSTPTADDGGFELWINGQKIMSQMDMPWAAKDGNPDVFINGYLWGWANSGFTEDTPIYVDDFAIYTSDPGW
jgi:uncharacterized protein YjdB